MTCIRRICYRARTLKFVSRRGLKLRVCSPARPPGRTNSNPADLTDGPKVFRSLPVGAGVQPRHLVAQPRRLFRGRGGGVDPDRPLRLPGDEAGAGDLLRRAGCAVLSILVGLAAFAAIWQNGSRGMGRILLAFLINARPARLSRPISACNTASCRRSTTSPPIRSTRRASRRWRGCAAAKAPTPRSMPASIRPNSSASPIPISRPWSSKSRRSGPMR